MVDEVLLDETFVGETMDGDAFGDKALGAGGRLTAADERAMDESLVEAHEQNKNIVGKSSRATPQKFHIANDRAFGLKRPKRRKPMNKVIGGFALLFLVGGTSTGASAGPWCAFYDPSTYNCGFQTYQQCLETVRGAGGYCRPNPFQGGAQDRRR
jgi:hypothetical protein